MLAITAATAIATTLLLVALSLNVSRLRLHHKVSSGDGGHRDLGQAIRAHGNLVEQVAPVFALLALAEASGVGRGWLAGAAALFVLARLAHAAGMLMRLSWLRRSGHVLTLLLLLMLAGTLAARLMVG
jgi:uncharacterized protein